jgi:hypothetical protein
MSNNNFVFSDTDISNVKMIASLENELVNKLNIFYKEYATYIRCISCNMTDSKCNRSLCSDSNLKTKYDDVNNLLNDITNKTKQLNIKGMDTTSYENRFNQIKQYHKNILNTRREFDEKLKYINDAQQSYNKIYDNSNKSSIYTGIVLSVLATSLLYYVFVKL